MRPAQTREKRFHFFSKRSIDISCSLIILIVLTPLLFLLFLLVLFEFGWPVFFTQVRPGQFARPFKIIKFRTMTNDCDSQGNLLTDQVRTKGLGRFMRKASLDELPEFINVIKGDMSLVGPRPLLVKYLPYFTDREKKRHNVKPGVTGLAQVKGRNLLTWEERLETDVQYVENLSLWLDVKILFMTVINVIRQKDALAVSSEQIPDFDDYRKDQLKNNAVGS